MKICFWTLEPGNEFLKMFLSFFQIWRWRAPNCNNVQRSPVRPSISIIVRSSHDALNMKIFHLKSYCFAERDRNEKLFFISDFFKINVNFRLNEIKWTLFLAVAIFGTHQATWASTSYDPHHSICIIKGLCAVCSFTRSRRFRDAVRWCSILNHSLWCSTMQPVKASMRSSWNPRIPPEHIPTA